MSIKYQSYRKLKYLPRKRLNYGQVWWVVAWITLLWQPMRPLSAAEVRSSSAVIENQRVRVVYNPATGTFDLVDKATDQAVIAGGHAEVAGWSTSATNRVRQARQMVGVDELGEASRLTIECDAPGEPTLLAEFSLYGQTNTFVILRNGIRNRTQTPLRVKEFYPVVDGQIFPGGAWSEVRTLNGDSSANQPQVTPQRFRSSANDLLLTLKQAGRRQSLVLGALKTADFTKWAHTTSKGGLNARSAVLDRTLPGVRLFSYLDCGTTKAPLAASGPRFFVRRGQSYAFGDSLFDRCFASVLFDAKEVVLEVAGLNPAKHYAVGFSWWDYDGNGRVETVAVGGAGQSHVLFEKRQLPAYAGKQQAPEERAAVIPADCYATGSFQLRFTNETNVPNAVVSEIWLWEMPSAIKLPDDWTQGHPASSSEDIRDESGLPVSACLEGSDPVGRLVEPGETYLPEDSFYVDGLTPDPFEALEKYGWQLRLATHARPNLYDFPTVCAWYAGVWKTPGAQDHPEKSTYKINTSSGLVEEAQQMKACGFLNYSRAAVRLVPDNYTRDNPQGWWDDEHWRQHGLYTPPYETSAKLGQGMHSNGCLAFTYIQPCQYNGLISADFRAAHQDWLIGGNLNAGLDFSLPAVQAHLRSRFAALQGHLDGFMVDYCDETWSRFASAGHFADAKMTGTAFYRMFFTKLREGIGAGARIHERNIQQPNNDLTLGLTDSQRTSGDTDKISPDLVSRSGLRWYKNRVVLSYDMDSKELNEGWKIDGWSGSDRDGRRMMVTMAYVAASRLLLANSFRDLSPEALHDLSRTFPYPVEPRSARPVDAFISKGWPCVYDFAINPKWHQVTLYNNTLPTREERISVPLHGDAMDGALGLDAGKEYYVFDFWNHQFVGRLKGSARLEQVLRPGEARMLSIHEVEPNPQFISANRHLMQGLLDMEQPPKCDPNENVLSGRSKVVCGETYEVVLAMNGYRPLRASATPGTARIEEFPGNPGLALLKLDSPYNVSIDWSVTYELER